MRHALVSLPCFLLALSATAAGQTVWIVDDDGGAGVDFTEIAAGVSAAGEGDVLLVRDGTYAEFGIGNKSLSIVAEAGHRPLISEQMVGSGSGDSIVRVTGLAAGKEVYLRGLDLGGTYFQAFSRTPFITLSNNAGEVWIEDCTTGVGGIFQGFTALHAVNCAGVNITRCVLEASVAGEGTYGMGILAQDSNLTLWDSAVDGAEGQPGFTANDGGHGISLSGGTLFSAGCTIRGGAGSSSTFFPVGGDGGHGLHVNGGALVRQRDCVLVGGAAGSGSSGPGVPGTATNVVAGTLLDVVGEARSFEISSPARAGVDSITATFHGQPNDLVYLLWSYSGQIPGFYLGLEHGSFVIDFTTLDGVALGALDGSGNLVYVSPPVALAGIDTFPLACQTAFLDAGGGGFYISGPSLLTLVGAGF